MGGEGRGQCMAPIKKSCRSAMEKNGTQKERVAGGSVTISKKKRSEKVAM